MRLPFLQYKEEILHKMRIWEIKENKNIFMEMEKFFREKKQEEINYLNV